jgi:transposase
MLRLLKSGAVRSRCELVAVVGYCERQLQRWGTSYHTGGREALLSEKPHGGSLERVTAPAWQSLTQAMARGEVTTLKDVQQHLHTRCGIPYTGVSGLSRLLQRHQVKLKTGRRRHRNADALQQAAFKKGLRRPAHAAGRWASLGDG